MASLPRFGLTASMTTVNGKNTHGLSKEQLTSLTLNLVTSTKDEKKNKQTHNSTSSFVTKKMPCQGKYKHPETQRFAMFSTILLHVLSVEINVANLENKQSHRNHARSYHKWLKVRWLSTNLTPTTPSDPAHYTQCAGPSGKWQCLL